MSKTYTLESSLIEHSAPTLAGMKCGSLFNCRFTSKERMQEEIATVNQKLNQCGVYIEAMLWTEQYVLIYVYRRSHLAKELERAEVKELLSYFSNDSKCLTYMKKL